MNFQYALTEREAAKCALCDGTAFSTLAAVDRYGMGVATVACDACGFITTDPVLTEAALDAFYKDQYRYVYSKVNEPSLEYIQKNGVDRRAKYVADFVIRKSNLPEGAKILDVGCAEGSILRAIRRLRPDLAATGVEPGTFGEFAKTHADCDVVATLELASEAAYDLVLLNHVLEHARDPLSLLRSLRERLTSDGFLFVDVPDASAYSEVDDLHVAHVHHFTPSSLTRIAARAGLRAILVEQHQPPRHPRSVRGLFTRDIEGVEFVAHEPQADDREAARRIQGIGASAPWATLSRWKPVRRVRHLLRRAAELVIH